MEALRIMVVEDDPKVAHAVSSSLRDRGLHTMRCDTGEEAIQQFEKERVDLVVLDLGLPGMDGIDVLQHIRAKTRKLPVLILTARDAVTDRILGLDGGADDYLVKPFSLSELLARIRALARRVEMGRQSTLTCHDLELDIPTRVVKRAGTLLELSPREFQLLQYLLEHQGEVVTRLMLAEDVWKYTSRVTPIDNIIDVQISRLREKIDKPFGTHLIKTVRGVGFQMNGGE